MHTSFETHTPVDLYVEVGKGTLVLEATDTTESTVEVTGDRADEVVVELNGDQLAIVAPRTRSGFFGGDADVDVRATVPTGSNLVTRTGSADVSAPGRWGSAQVRAGSGQVDLGSIEGPASIESGSGDVRVARLGAVARLKAGSGDVSIRETGGPLSASAGSGDVEIGHAAGPTSVKTGSGSLRVASSDGDLEAASGSGDVVLGRLLRGRFQAKGASGDISVGIPGGIPVWTDVSSVSGHVRSDLTGAGVPKDGQDHVELRAKTVSGDIALKQL